MLYIYGSIHPRIKADFLFPFSSDHNRINCIQTESLNTHENVNVALLHSTVMQSKGQHSHHLENIPKMEVAQKKDRLLAHGLQISRH